MHTFMGGLPSIVSYITGGKQLILRAMSDPGILDSAALEADLEASLSGLWQC